ncbi:MAG: mechanosensitive ion channel [Bradymonadales bacterium]|nr:mechanosensitive ion channel [Bradymonadales bacterium]
MSVWDHLKAAIVNYGPKLLLAIVVLWIGLFLIRKLVELFDRRAEKRQMDPSLRPFLRTLISIALKIMLVISVASMVGVAMTSFVAVLGAAGLAVGLALQGSLANFGGGVLILAFRPFKVGDVIEAQGYTGKVSEIQVFNTVLKTLDNKTIIIPNGPLSNGSLVNYSTEPTRRVDMIFSVAYGEDIEQVKTAVSKVVDTDPRILREPASYCRIAKLAESSVDFSVRVWCKGEDYFDVLADVVENVKKEFDRQKINIPFPHLHVHMEKV